MSYDGTTYINCVPQEDGMLKIIINGDHKLSNGELFCERKWDILDVDFTDGKYPLVDERKTGIELTYDITDGTVATVSVPLFFQRGLPGMSAYEHYCEVYEYTGTIYDWFELMFKPANDMAIAMQNIIDTYVAKTAGLDELNKQVVENEQQRILDEQSRETSERNRMKTFNKQVEDSNCSGVRNVLIENGPFRLNRDGVLTSNPFGWNNVADVVYLDQPMGTGFSNCSNIERIPKTLTEAAKDVFYAMKSLIKKHPEYKNRKFYILGHSFSGHFIPVVTEYFYNMQCDFLDLMGIGIGNGWYKPETQIKSFGQFNYEHNLLRNSIYYYFVEMSVYLCDFFHDLNWYTISRMFFRMASAIANGASPRFNMYDIRQNCSIPPGCNNDTYLSIFANRADVRSELKVGDRIWIQCSRTVDIQIEKDFFIDVSSTLKELLDKHKDLKVVLFNGNQDWLCNTKGMELFLDEFEWHGRDEFKNTPWTTWYVSGKLAGKYKEVRNFRYYDVNNAGHMVSFDQPEFGYDIYLNLLNPEFSKQS